MLATINDLPYELLSQILEKVIHFNVKQISRKTFAFDAGLHAPPDPDVRMQRLLKGLMPPDSVRWTASNSIRQVSSRWHQMALKYAFKELYVLSWRGGKNHTISGLVRTTPAKHLGLATSSVYGIFLRKTAELIENHPTLPSYIRRIWFDGCYEAKESALIFGMLHQCKKLEEFLIPSIALRHGTVADWSSLFGSNMTGPWIKVLEIRATKLPNGSVAINKENRVGNNALASPKIDFTNLACLRLFGSSNVITVTDEDLIAIARTANNLRELHVTDAASVGPKGVGALIRSSQSSLEVLMLDSSSQLEPELSVQHNSHNGTRLSQLIARCPHLRNLRLQFVHTCRDIFACGDVAWSGNVQICLGANGSFLVPQSEMDTTVLYQIFDQARYLMSSMLRANEESLEIEVLVSGFMFEPGRALVHGDFTTTHAFGEPWLVEKKASHKTLQMTGYVRTFPFCITEDEFRDGLYKSYVWL